MRAIWNWLVLASACAVLGGCVAAKPVDERSFFYTEQEEIQLGEEISTGLLGAADLHPNQGLQRYVNEVGRWVASKSYRPNLPWTFGVLDSEGINAFAAPGGKVFITFGLLKRLSSEAELAAVLSHEIAHVIAQHHTKALEAEKKQSDQVAVLGQLADIGLSTRSKSASAAIAKEVGKKVLVPLVKDAAKKLYVSGLDKSLEYQADALGVTLLARAGYEPYAMVSVLQVLQAQRKDDPFFEVLAASHPNPSDRIAELEKLYPILMTTNPRATELGRDRFYLQTGIPMPRTSVATSEPAPAPVAAPSAPTAQPTKQPAKNPPPKRPAKKL
jgi:beta-barrel assembly-enhancing protease